MLCLTLPLAQELWCKQKVCTGSQQNVNISSLSSGLLVPPVLYYFASKCIFLTVLAQLKEMSNEAFLIGHISCQDKV